MVLEANGVRGLELIENNVANSITKFLILPTIAAKAISRSKDPIIDFSKSVMLTADNYFARVELLQVQRDSTIREKKRKQLEREETKKQKAKERE